MRRSVVVALCILSFVSPQPSGAAPAAYELAEVRHVQVVSHDGVVLDGWVGLPALPKGRRAPVVLNSTPYLGSCLVHPTSTGCYRTPASPVPLDGETWWDDGVLHPDQSFAGLGIFPIEWVRHGFALASFSLRGTGASGGCLDVGGRAEQLDQKVLIEWLAAQPWSNGRVGMGGLSYPGWTVWQAAVQAPPALRAIVSVAPIVDYGGYHFTPQGARISSVTGVTATYYPQYAGPPVLGTPTAVISRAACPNTADARQSLGGYLAGSRDRSYYTERNLTPNLGRVRAAVLHTQGYADAGHFFQDHTLTSQLKPRVPVREIRGWWTHEFPNGVSDNRAFTPPQRTGEKSWREIVLRWMGYWLTGRGPRPPLGIDHLDQLGTWHDSTSWPPREARRVSVQIGAGSFRSVPPFHETAFPSLALGASTSGPAPLSGLSVCAPGTASLTTYDISADLVIAGNPFARLRITTDRPEGIVGVTLYDLEPGFSCTAGGPSGMTWIASGGADLAFYRLVFEREPVAVGAPIDLRIDLLDTTARIRAGHRLGVVVSHPDWITQLAEPGAYPSISVDSASRIDLPVLSGRLG